MKARFERLEEILLCGCSKVVIIDILYDLESPRVFFNWSIGGYCK